MDRDPLADVPDAHSPEILPYAPQIGVAAVDHPAFCGGGNQHRSGS
jgi:hypothetical protein